MIDPSQALAGLSGFGVDPVTQQVMKAHQDAMMKYSGWGPWFDALNANAPGGIKQKKSMGSGPGTSTVPLQGLQQSLPGGTGGE